jgi:hypothetical protein
MKNYFYVEIAGSHYLFEKIVVVVGRTSSTYALRRFRPPRGR